MNTDTVKTTAEAEIRELVENWLQAVRSKDINKVMSHYAADILTFDIVPPCNIREPMRIEMSIYQCNSTWMAAAELRLI